MSIKLTLLSVDGPTNRATLDALIQVSLTGSYPAGGETLDFSTLAGQQSQEGYIVDADTLPVEVYAESQAAQFGYGYQPSTYTAAAVPTPLTWKTCKFHVLYTQVSLGTIGTEFSAGAYPSGILQDFILMRARFIRER